MARFGRIVISYQGGFALQFERNPIETAAVLVSYSRSTVPQNLHTIKRDGKSFFERNLSPGCSLISHLTTIPAAIRPLLT
jgi:hypothetical protein